MFNLEPLELRYIKYDHFNGISHDNFSKSTNG